MPTNGGYYYGFWEENPRKWARCKAQAAEQMLADGWLIHSKKFLEVQRRKAKKIWDSSK
jgi:hypothetical protein